MQQEVLQDEEAEMAVLACCLLNINALFIAHKLLQPEHFMTPHHRHIWVAIRELAMSDGSVDRISIKKQLEKNDTWKFVGVEKLARLTQNMPLVEEINKYCYILVEAHKRRSLKQLLIQSLKDVDQLGVPTEQIMGSILVGCQDLGEPTNKHFTEALVDEREKWLNIITNRDSFPEFPFPNITRHLCDPMPGNQLNIVAAQTSKGKTAYAIALAFHNASKDIPTLFFSLEMSIGQIARRIARYETGFDITDQGELSKRALERFITNNREIPLTINDSVSDLDDIVNITTSEHFNDNCRLLCVDYLGLVTTNRFGKINLIERLGKITGTLKNLGKRLGIDIILNCQLNRSSAKDDRKPALHDLRDSGMIENDADNVYLLHWDNTESRFMPVTLIKAKSRDGMTGEATIFFDKQLGAYCEGLEA